MLISTVRFYGRIQLGLHQPDPDIQEYATSCLSYLVCFLRLRQIDIDHLRAVDKHNRRAFRRRLSPKPNR